MVDCCHYDEYTGLIDLLSQCTANKFVFMEHNNINLREHVSRHDDVHLNKEGSKLLQDNLLNYLNHVDD